MDETKKGDVFVEIAKVMQEGGFNPSVDPSEYETITAFSEGFNDLAKSTGLDGFEMLLCSMGAAAGILMAAGKLNSAVTVLHAVNSLTDALEALPENK